MAENVQWHEKTVKGSDVKKIIDKGPEYFYETLRGYINDVHTLTERMQDLFEENLIVYTLSHLQVTVKVHAKGELVADFSFGVSETGPTENEQTTAQ